jgi:hypothetical protein
MDNIVDMAMDSIEDALTALARGEMVIVLDDKGRENEGDLIIAADHATPEALAFIVRHRLRRAGRGSGGCAWPRSDGPGQ